MSRQSLVAHIPGLRRYARALTGDAWAADDLVQDTLERAWSQLAQWRAGSSLRPWLLSIMHNLRIDQLRRPGLSISPMDDADLDVPTRATQTDRLEVRDLAHALSRLPEEQREVIIMRHFADMSFKEIAEQTNVSINTALGRMRYALINLRKLVKEKDIILSL